jgi:putative membrane protein
MLASSFIAFLHFVFAFGIAATLFFEWYTFSKTPSLRDAQRLSAADRWYGAFAMGLLAVGTLRVVYFEKGWEFYRATPFFHLKITLFVLIGLLSIYPTVSFMRWRSAIQAGQAPQVSEQQYQRISRSLALQLMLLVPLVLSASLMAKGMRF